MVFTVELKNDVSWWLSCEVSHLGNMLAGTERQQQTTLRPNQAIRPPTHNGTTTNLQLPVLAVATAQSITAVYHRRLLYQPTNQLQSVLSAASNKAELNQGKTNNRLPLGTCVAKTSNKKSKGKPAVAGDPDWLASNRRLHLREFTD